MARRRGGNFEIETRLKGGKETARGFDEIADAQKRAGRQTEEMSAKGGRLSGVLDKLGSGAKGFIAGFVGIAAIQRGLSAIIGHMERILALRREITQEGLDVRETTLPLAAQLFAGGGLTQQQAQILAAEMAPQIARGGVDIATATQIGVAGDVNLEGGLRGSARKRNVGILTRLAGFGGGANLGEQEVTKLLEILNTFKLTGSEEDVFTGIAQLQAAFSKSRATSQGVFATGFQGPATALQIAGFSLPEALELFVQARKVEKSDIRGGESLNILSRALQSANTAKLFPGEDFLNLPVQQRLALMRQLFAGNVTAEQRSKLVPEISEENVLRLGNLLGPTNVAATADVLEKILAADAEAVRTAAREFSQSNVGQRRAIAADRAARREQRSRVTAGEVRLSRTAEEILKERLESGEVSGLEDFLLFDQAQEDEIFLELARKIAAERGTTVEQELRKRGRRDLLGPFGRIPRGPIRGLGEARRAAIGRAMQSLEAQPNTTVINNNINTQVILDPTRPDTTSRNGQLDPGGAQ